MRIVFTVVLLFLSRSLFAQSETLLPVQTIVADVNNDAKPDTIRLSSSFPGTDIFTHISISITGYGIDSFTAKSSWTSIDKSFHKKNKNAAKSHLFFLARGDKQSALLLFGERDASGYRNEFSIISIRNNQAFMVLDDDGQIDIEAPTKIEDLDKDGHLDFVYTGVAQLIEVSDSFDADIKTYCPFMVYTIDDECVLNKPLTEKYNRDHYVWAGYEYNEDIRVLHPHDKSDKPMIIR